MRGFQTPSGGSNKWSQVIIDADKDMGGYGLTELKELALGMNPGDMLAYNATTGEIGIILCSTIIGNELLTRGVIWPPVWGFPDIGKYP